MLFRFYTPRSYETLEGTESGRPTAVNLNSERSSSLDCEYSYKSVNLKLESFLNNKLGTSHPSLSSARRKIRKLSSLFNYNYLVRSEGRNCGGDSRKKLWLRQVDESDESEGKF